MDTLNIENLVGKKILIVGAGGSGKDWLKQQLSERGFKKEISYTTREKRENEKDGVHYHFVTKEEFQSMADADDFLQWNTFENGHHYGTHKASVITSDLFIMSPNMVSQLMDKGNIPESWVVIYLMISEDLRLSRMLTRGSKDGKITLTEKDIKEILRRKNSDRVDFEGFCDLLGKRANKKDTIILSDEYVLS